MGEDKTFLPECFLTYNTHFALDIVDSSISDKISAIRTTEEIK